MKPFPFPSRRPSRTGSALVISLLFVVLIAILVIGFLTSMKLESTSASAHLSGVQAQLFADAGTDSAVAAIREATKSTNTIWYSQPGAISIVASGTEPARLLPLFSGSAAAGADADEAASLNATRLADPSRRLLATASNAMKVRWLYVLQDGTVAAASPPPYNPANPAVGRYAFWTDDECARLNINTAWTRDAANTNSAADVSRVNLKALFGGEADAIDSFRKALHPFHSTQDIQKVSDAVAAAARDHFFALSYFNRTPDRNVFGEKRIMLTTRADLAGASDFIDILASAGADPGLVANLDPTKVSNTVARIAAILNRKDWPYLPGVSFAEKFTPVKAEQIALNIIEYVRCRESAQQIVEPILGSKPGSAFAMPLNTALDYSVNPMVGNTRGPRITEMGVYVPATKNSDSAGDYFDVLFKVKVCLPPAFGIEQIDLRQHVIVTQIYNPSNILYGREQIGKSRSYVEGGDPILKAGESRVVVNRVRVNTSTRPVTMDLRVMLNSLAADQPYDVAPAVRGPSAQIVNICVHYTVDPVATGSTAVTSFAVDDPSLNKHRGYWKKQSGNTLGQVRSSVSTLGQASSASPQQDTDGSPGNITDAGMVFPAPKGSAPAGQLANLSGLVESVGELGFIHSGLVCEAALGAPWRTLRLQPKNVAASLPDWALLDMFSVPKASPKFFEKPDDGLGGRVNLNAKLAPFSDDATFTRLQPLEAVFRSAISASGTVDATAAQTLAENITAGTLATGANPGNSYGLGGWLSRGQIAEVRGIADAGEASERLVRETVELLAARSSTFTVYSIGQAIRQNASGIRVIGERRTETLVEGKESSGGLTYRTVSYRNLRP